MLSIDRRGVLAGIAAVPFAASARPVLATEAWRPDASVRPGDDFYRHVNGAWLRSATIPPSLGAWSDFARLEEVTAERTRTILDAAARAPSRETRAFGELYAALTDAAAIERAGLSPIAADLAAVDAVASPVGLARALAFIARSTPRDPFGAVAPSDPVPATPIVFLDTADSSRFLPNLIQGGLGLPDREYYLVDKPAFAAAREAYRIYLSRLFALVGGGDPTARAAAVIALEEQLARAHRPRFELFDFAKRRNSWTPTRLAAEAPGFDWATYLREVGYGGQPQIVVADPPAIIAFAAQARDAGWPVWRDYLRARLLSAFALAGPVALADARFDYRERALKGATEPLPAWRRAGKVVDLVMGQAVGAAYRRRYLPPGAQASIERMVALIKAAMQARIEGAVWMAPSTKSAALEKLTLLQVEVGGPPRVADYRPLRTDRAAPWQSLTRASAFAYDLTLAKLGRAVDRGEWDMYPHSINGIANPLLNKIMFSAGMLQPPLYDPAGDAAANFGALGAFIAHEVSHMFDNVGSRFDAAGRMRDWWTPADRTRYDAATAALAKQFDAYEIAPGLNANGRQTLHENVADLGGLTLALDAYRLHLNGGTAPVVDGLTGERRFFMAWARMWREQMRDAAVRSKAAAGTHSMGRLRANTVRNLDAWYQAFDVKPDAALYLAPEARVSIW